MVKGNGSSFSEFLLLGLSDDPDVQIYLFILFFFLYIFTITGNILLIILWATDARLQTPMYFFLVNLALGDIGLSTVIVPNMLFQFVYSKKISFSGCATQAYTALMFAIMECVLMAVMAYDRYIAIASPLRYVLIMKKYICAAMAAVCWLIAIVESVLGNVFAQQLPVCKSNVINHVHCEGTTFIKITCADSYVAEVVYFILAVVLLPIPSFIIFISYVCIIVTILGMRSSAGRYKAFSTCSSHFIVVTMFYGTALFQYMRPLSKNMEDQDKIISLFYSVIPPLLNPMIYSLRNKDVKMALKKLFQKEMLIKL